MHTIPNAQTISNKALSRVYQIDIDVESLTEYGTGWFSGCALTAQSSPDMTRQLSSGIVIINKTRVNVSGQNTSTITPDTTLPLWVLYEIDTSGVVHVTHGTPATDPLIPGYTNNRAVIGADYILANQSSISGTLDRDLRVYCSATDYDATGTAATAISDHIADTDPHGDRAYVDAAISNIPGAGNLGTAAELDVAVSGDATPWQVVKGDDTRLTNARTPTAHATSHGSAGSDPVTLAQSQVTGLTSDLGARALSSDLIAETSARVNADNAHVAASDPHTQYALEVNLGTAAAQNTTAFEAAGAVASHASASDPHGDRVYAWNLLSAATPKAHASTHAAAGSDPITITEAQVTGLTTDLATLTTADATEASARATADALLIPLTQKGSINGVAPLNGSAVIDDSYIPASIARDAEVTSAVNSAIATLISGAPSTLDTLDEIAAALNDDPNFVSTITTLIGTKIAKSLYDANTILAANSDDTPVALTVGEQTLVGRITGGNIAALSVAQIKTLLAYASTDLSDSASIYRSGGTDVAIADGGTGASDAAGARSNLGLGSAALLASTAFVADPGSNGIAVRSAAGSSLARTITAGSAKLVVTNGSGVSGNPTIDLGSVASTDLSDSASIYKVSGTDVAVADGGTGASTAAGARTNLGVVIGTDVQAYDASLTTVATAFSSVKVPIKAHDRLRTKNPIFTKLTAAVSSTTQATIAVKSAFFTTSNLVEVIKIDSEEMLAVYGQGSTTLWVQRGINGTTAATHASGAIVRKSLVANVGAIGDSTTQGTNLSGGVGWAEMARAMYGARFGGSLGAGFFGVWRNTDSMYANSADPVWGYGAWANSGTWSYYFPSLNNAGVNWANQYASGSTSNYTTFSIPAGEIVAQADVLWVDADNFDNAWSWRYSTDNQSTWSSWADNPNPPSWPNASTTLTVTDNGRLLSYWDGTKTMTITSATSFPTAGFFELTISGGQVARFVYAGVSGNVLSSVKLIRGSGTWTSVTNQVVRMVPDLKRSKLTGFSANPTDIQIRAANAAGTSKSINLAGIDLWSTAPVLGVTKGMKFHNLGYDGQRIHFFVANATYDDVIFTSATPTITSSKVSFDANYHPNRLVISPNVTYGTRILSVLSSTQALMTANASASGTAITTIGEYTSSDWSKILDGFSGSIVFDEIIVMTTNDQFEAERFVTDAVTSTAGTGKTITSATGNFTALDVGKAITCTGVPSNAVIASINSSTSVESSLTSTSSGSGRTLTLYPTPSFVYRVGMDAIRVLYERVKNYCDLIIVAPFEQGGARLTTGELSSGQSIMQQQWRQAMKDAATTYGLSSLDIFQAWSAEGYVGYAAAAAGGLMIDTLHESTTGCRDLASRIGKIEEVF